MPVVRFLKRFVEIPSTWDGWAMRILTISVFLTFCASWMLFVQVSSLHDQLTIGRAERNAFQDATEDRLCTILEHDPKLTPDTVKALGC